MGAQRPFDFVIEAVSVKNGGGLRLQGFRCAGGAEAEIETQVDMAGNDVVGTGAGLDFSGLPSRRRKEGIAVIPDCCRQLGQCGCGKMDRVFRQMGVGDMSLDSLDS